MKKLLSVLLALCVVLACVPALAQAYTEGVYTAQANGNNGPVTVQVTVSGDAITDVQVTEHGETPGISDTPIERIPGKIVEGQTLAVDTVAGATNTSKAILAAVEDCLTQAGADIEALKIAAADDAEQTVTERDVQVLVIGAGGSGMAAAITLKEQGVDVLLIDKMPTTGGATALTGALIDGGMSNQQAIRGATDDVQTMFMDVMSYGSFLNDARMTWLFVNNTGRSVDWLHDNVGVEFEEDLNYFPEHTNDRALYPLGKLPGYLTGTMENHYREMGGELLLETHADHLLFEDGRVVGATCTTPDGILNIHADATILATGGYGASVALRPADLTTVLFYGASASMGEGIVMAQEVGAKTHYMQYLKSYPQGIERPLEGGNISEDGKTYKSNALISPLASQAATLEEAAEKAGIDAAGLTATVAHFNEMVAAGEDADFGRAEMSVALEDDGCWYIIEQRLRMATSLGGLKTSTSFEVYDEDENVIPGLYACGETVGGVHGDESMPSNMVGWAITSGHLTGEAVAQAVADK